MLLLLLSIRNNKRTIDQPIDRPINRLINQRDPERANNQPRSIADTPDVGLLINLIDPLLLLLLLISPIRNSAVVTDAADPEL